MTAPACAGCGHPPHRAGWCLAIAETAASYGPKGGMSCRCRTGQAVTGRPDPAIPPPPGCPIGVMSGDGERLGWCSLAALPEVAGAYRRDVAATGREYTLWQWFEDRWLLVETGGPSVVTPGGWLRWPGRPVDDGPGSVRRFLYEIRAAPALLDPAGPGAPSGRPPGASADWRVNDEAHECVRCYAEPIGVAVVVHPPGPPGSVLWPEAVPPCYGDRWLDLCHRCYAWLRAGLADAEREEMIARYEALNRAATLAEADQAWRALRDHLGGPL